MSGLIDAVRAALGFPTDEEARLAVLAVADWLDGEDREVPAWLPRMLRVEVAPPPPKTTVMPPRAFTVAIDGEKGRWINTEPVTLTWQENP